MATTALCDLNHWVQWWLYFKVAGNADCTNLCEITSTGLKPLLQYFYMKQISKAFPPGSHFRLCLSNKELPNKQMFWKFGKKPAISAAAAVRPDGTWAVALSNFTGIGVIGKWENVILGETYSAMNFDVTIKIAELADENETFDVYLSDENNRIKLQANQANMTNGEVTVTIKPKQLLTLVSAEARSPIRRTMQAKAIYNDIIVYQAGRTIKIAMNEPQHYSIALVDLSGRKVFARKGYGQSQTIELPVHARGTYMLRVTAARGTVDMRIAL
jgi:hypothetical protein